MLLDRIPDKFLDLFQKKVSESLKSKSSRNYWKVLSEMRAVCIFENLGVSVKEIDVKTVKNKDVDFSTSYVNETIYVEVKGFDPVDYVIAKRGGALGLDEDKIDRALERAQDKFLPNSLNIVVIADEDTLKPSVFENYLSELGKIPESYLLKSEYRKTSGLMMLGGYYEEQLFMYKFWRNYSANLTMPEGLVKIFAENA